MPNLYMVVDVESVGLHGEGFAVGWLVIDEAGAELACGHFACQAGLCKGTQAGAEWVQANVPPLRLTHAGPYQVREAFWAAWREWKARGARLVADCPWPVEARFLAACVDDERPVTRGGWQTAEGPRDWEGPYPFLDVASVRLAAGLDPVSTCARLPGELPAHDPLADARQSARLFAEALRSLKG